ncbi:MAG: DUF2600 family protein, partial [Firmicutes bacterium]|nr:DUF2600 family protein [Bacillota bacterium]
GRALCAALDPAVSRQDWYEHFPHKNDGGYLDALVGACSRIVAFLPGFRDVREEMAGLAALYSELQVLKHLAVDKRKQRLVSWFADHSAKAPGVTWWEFAAAAGSTLGIFALDPAVSRQDWYEHFPHKNDGGYLDALVGACSRIVAFLPG